MRYVHIHLIPNHLSIGKYFFIVQPLRIHSLVHTSEPAGHIRLAFFLDRQRGSIDNDLFWTHGPTFHG